MAELATIARPYAEALLKAGGSSAQALELSQLAELAANPDMMQFAADPKAQQEQVSQILQTVYHAQFGHALSGMVINLLTVVLDNGRLYALPAIYEQFHELVNRQLGVSDAAIYSAFELSVAQKNDIQTSLEQRFKRKLNTTVVMDTSLIGGIRVVVGDEVLDTSVKARLEQMKVALTT